MSKFTITLHAKRSNGNPVSEIQVIEKDRLEDAVNESIQQFKTKHPNKKIIGMIVFQNSSP